jgi:RHS repeat-associated protein
VAGYLYDTDAKLKPFLFHHDNVNSVSQMSGHNGGTLQSTTFSAFGNIHSTTGTTPNRLKYTGREDDGTGLYYYRARYYDPGIGRFVSEDPLGFQAGINFFAYVGNNPVNANDPSGKVDVILTIGKQQLDVRNQGTPGTNYLVRASANGTLYPMGAGGFGQDPSKFTQLIAPQQTSALIDWGRSHIQNNRLFGAGGEASLAETLIQSLPGAAWDTKQYLPRNALYVINGKAELNDYVGNAIWGAGVNSLGISQSVATFGATLQGTMRGGEDPRDQEAINFGYSLPLPSFRGSGASGSWDSGGASGLWGSAGGGFLLYPNKANSNMMRSVYSK